ETVFAAANVASALKLAHARGVLLAAAARAGLRVFEYEPRLVKKALVGYGNAEKEQVRAMVLSLLARQRARIPLDAADALAVAICHVHSRTRYHPASYVLSGFHSGAPRPRHHPARIGLGENRDVPADARARARIHLPPQRPDRARRARLPQRRGGRVRPRDLVDGRLPVHPGQGKR